MLHYVHQLVFNFVCLLFGAEQGAHSQSLFSENGVTLYFDSPSVDTLQVISGMSAVYQLTFNNTVSTDK